MTHSDDGSKRQPTSRDPEVQSGKLVFSGTRVPVDALWDHLRAGGTFEAFFEGYPTVERWQVEALLDQARAALGRVPDDLAFWWRRDLDSGDPRRIERAVRRMTLLFPEAMRNEAP